MKRTIFLFVVMVFGISCAHEKVVTPCVTPNTVSFQQDIQPIINQHCNTTGCHSGTTPSGNLNLEASVSYAQLTKRGSGYIDTLTPQYSVLYASMNATVNPMPPNGKLDDCTVALVLKWIEQKAKDN